MDSKSYPLIDLYCEDLEAKKIIKEAIKAVEINKNINNFSELINIIISGSADKTYTHFISHMETYELKKIKSGFACILDGDMKNMKSNKGALTFPPTENLHFLFSNECPEKFLARAYLSDNPNVNIEYYLENENPHYLFKTIIEHSTLKDINEVFDHCWSLVIKSEKGKIYFETLQLFLINMVKKYSPEL